MIWVTKFAAAIFWIGDHYPLQNCGKSKFVLVLFHLSYLASIAHCYRLRVLKHFSTKKRWLPLQPSLSVANIGVQQQSQVRSNCTNRAGDQLISDFSVSRRSSLSHLDRRPSTLVHYGRLNTNVAPNPILMAALTNMGIASPVTPVTPQFPASEFVPVPGKLQIDIEPKTVANLVDHAKFRKADYHNSVQTPTSALPSAASVSSNESDGISPLFFDKSRYYVS